MDKKVYKIKILGNTAKKQLQVSFNPPPSADDAQTRDAFINLFLAAYEATLPMLFQTLNVLPEPTTEEHENHVYVFRNEYLDTKLFKARLGLYQEMQQRMTTLLHTLFPDVEYIESCRQYQQEYVTELNSEQAGEYQKHIAAIAERVRNPKVASTPYVDPMEERLFGADKDSSNDDSDGGMEPETGGE